MSGRCQITSPNRGRGCPHVPASCARVRAGDFMRASRRLVRAEPEPGEPFDLAESDFGLRLWCGDVAPRADLGDGLPPFHCSTCHGRVKAKAGFRQDTVRDRGGAAHRVCPAARRSPSPSSGWSALRIDMVGLSPGHAGACAASSSRVATAPNASLPAPTMLNMDGAVAMCAYYS